jgi:alpha-L-fucosidase
MFVLKSVRMALIVALAAGLLVGRSVVRAEPDAAPAEETKEQRDQRMAWWRDARFGMFIHWGLYSVPAGTWQGKQIPSIGEWIMNNAKIPVKDYAALTKQFNPVKFDADAWVKLAKRAGMKYIVITSKHHDGFAMFHSKTSPYNIYDATPFHRDPLKELADACKKNGMRLGFYYSQAQDWHHPGGVACAGHWDKAQDGDTTEYIRNVAVPQVRELLTNYGPLAVLWWDTPCDMTKERADLLHPLLKLQPNIITNNRLGGGYAGDTETPEQFIPATGYPGRDWETCMTLNDTWGFKSYDNNWKATKVLLRNLVDIASKGGNYLLNVGPTSEGLIPEPSVERLTEVGRWMDVNSDSIYGTSASPFKRLAWGRCTQKPGTLYLHVFDWPKGDLIVPGLKNKVTKAYLLADRDKTALPVEAVPEGVAIKLPTTAPDAMDSVVALEIEGKPEVIAQALTQGANGVVTLTATDASLHGESCQFQVSNGKENIGSWTNQNDWVSWDVQINTPGKFNVEVSFACDTGSVGSEYEVLVGDQKLSGKVENTGGWEKFVTRKLGELSVAEAGRYTVSLKPTSKPHDAVMNLESITLKPAKP